MHRNSLRRTELFHETCDRTHFGPVGLIGLQGCDLRSQSLPDPDPCGFMHQRGSDRLGLRQALSL